MASEYKFTFPQDNVDTTACKVRINKGGGHITISLTQHQTPALHSQLDVPM